MAHRCSDVGNNPPPSSDRETLLQYRTPRQGGVAVLSSGANITIRNSTFVGNTAQLDAAGAIYLNENTEAHFEGDHNIFTGNKCNVNGGVLAATDNTLVTVEGGIFKNNEAGEVRGENPYGRNRGESFSREP